MFFLSSVCFLDDVIAANLSCDERTITRIDNQNMSCSGAISHSSQLTTTATGINGESATPVTTTTKLSHINHHALPHSHTLDTSTLVSGSPELGGSLQGPSIWSPDGSTISVNSASLSSSWSPPRTDLLACFSVIIVELYVHVYVVLISFFL